MEIGDLAWAFVIVLLLIAIGVGAFLLGDAELEAFEDAHPDARAADPVAMEDPMQERDFGVPEVRGDVQKRGRPLDLCRVVQKRGEQDNRFVACALGGGSSSWPQWQRSPTERDGFLVGFKPYMRDVTRDGRSDYCRIIRFPHTDLFVASCAVGEAVGFGKQELEDPNPPDDVARMLWWLQGAMLYMPLDQGVKDLVDDRTVIAAMGTLLPDAESTEGLELNGVDNQVMITQPLVLSPVRAMTCWVRVRSVTKNMRIVDFGNGEGADNFVVGVEGTTNNLLVEFWDGRRRAMRIRVQNFFVEGAWQHVAISADSERSTRPAWTVQKNGQAVAQEENGFQPSTTIVKRNFVGRSNWSGDGQWSGSIADLRLYRIPLTSAKLASIVANPPEFVRKQ